ncbi:MAG TPA: hypothetical protein VHZ96_01695 [Frankiaceae bacterium]|nr:hypothetical protein [Frankiaceae bacterium]
MSQQPVVLASVLRVPDYDRWESMLEAATDRMRELGVMRRWAYRSLTDPSEVFSGVLVSSAEQAMGMMRSLQMTDWMVRTGVEELPPFFVGSRVASFDLTAGERVDGQFIVASIHTVRDFDRWMTMVDTDRPWMVEGGTRHVWLYRAIDDPGEVMGMMSLRSEAAARSLLRGGLTRESWFDESGIDVHPPAFVGRRTQIVDYDEGLAKVD